MSPYLRIRRAPESRGPLMSYREERVWLINPFASDTVWTLLVIAIRHDSTMIGTSLHYNKNTVPHPYCVHLTKC